MNHKLLLTNDDGIEAPGLAALAEVAAALGEVTVIAPVEQQSGCSHQVTTSAPLRVHSHGPRRWSVDGTPADCVRLGLHRLASDTDWVLSGINAGGNLGADVYHSGTVAAVREAVLHGFRGIAFSHYVRRRQPIDWPQAVRWLVPLSARLMAEPLARGEFWNVNLPHLTADMPPPEVVFCPLDSTPLPLSFAPHEGQEDYWQYIGDYASRQRDPGGDVDVCFGGRIAVTKLRLY